MSSRRTAQEGRLRAHLVRRAIETDAPLLAAALHRYATAERIAWEDLARTLDCTLDDLNGIAICRPPRAGRFVEDVQAIADGHVNADRLLRLLRRLQVLETLAGRTQEASDSFLSLPAEPGVLLAARDREEDALDSTENAPGPSSAPDTKTATEAEDG